MQLGEQLLASAASLAGPPFYPPESSSARGGQRSQPSSGSPQRLDLDKGPKKCGSAGPGMLSEAEAGEPFPGAGSKQGAPDGRKAAPCGEAELPPAAAARYPLDSLSPERYYLQSPGPQGAELGGPCSLFPYPPAAQHGSVYQSPGGARYPYGSMLSPGGFSAAVCSPGGRPQFGGGGGGYQYGQGAAGPLYTVPGSGPGLRAQVFLCNRPLWLKFHRHQTEMIITKQAAYVGGWGRRSLPASFCKARFSRAIWSPGWAGGAVICCHVKNQTNQRSFFRE
uniref:T-box domain-containing protein n=1 Tax=Chelydra serpentina TaxID=8475 RepID=A0A8C3RYP5_CHESE